MVSAVITRDQASTTQWNGFGSSHTSSVEIPVGDTMYEVYSGVEEDGSGDNAMMVPSGGATGTTGSKKTSYTCTDNSIESYIEGIDLKSAQPTQSSTTRTTEAVALVSTETTPR